MSLSKDMAQTVRDMRPHWAAKVRRERSRALKAEEETKKLLQAAQYLEGRLDDSVGKLEEAERRFAEERSEAAEAHRRLRSELARAQDRAAMLEAARPRIGGPSSGGSAGSAAPIRSEPQEHSGGGKGKGKGAARSSSARGGPPSSSSGR